MVDDDARQMATPGGISAIVDILLLSASHSDIAHDDVVARGVDVVIAQGNARGWCRLSEDGSVGTDVDILGEGDDTADIKDNNFLVGAADGSTERTGAGVVEVGDVYNLAATSACGVSAVTLSAGEGWSLSGDGQRGSQ